MPCWSRVRSEVEFGAKTDEALLAKALESLGWTVRKVADGLSLTKPGAVGQFANGRLTVVQAGEFGQTQINEVKRAYSAQVVQAASKRFGWSVKTTGEHQYQITRRI